MEANRKYICHVENYGMKETKTGKTAVWVKLYSKDDHSDSVIWTGYFSGGKGEEIAFKALKAMGFKGDIEGLNKGTDSDALDLTVEVEVETELNTWTNSEGKTIETVKAKWINSPRASNQAQRLAPEKVHINKAKLQSAWKTFEIEQKTKDRLPPQVPQKEATNDSDIGF